MARGNPSGPMKRFDEWIRQPRVGHGQIERGGSHTGRVEHAQPGEAPFVHPLFGPCLPRQTGAQGRFIDQHERHGFARTLRQNARESRGRFAVNHAFAHESQRLRANDEIALIAMVGGG